MFIHTATHKLVSTGIVVAITGVVAVVGVDGVKRLLKLGDPLSEGDDIVTGESGEVVIGFADGNSVEIGRDSQQQVMVNEQTGDSSGVLAAMRESILDGQPAAEVLQAAAAGEYSLEARGNSSDGLELGLGDSGAYPFLSEGTDQDQPPAEEPDNEVPDDSHVEAPVQPLPVLTIASVEVKEPATDDDNVAGEATGVTSVIVFSVSLSEVATEDVTLHFKTVDGSAIASGHGVQSVDYEHNAGVLTIAAGETSATIEVLVYGDDIVEGDETFYISLSHVENATLGNSHAEGLIVDNEPSGSGDGGLQIGGSDDTPGDNEATAGDDIIHGSGGHDVLEGMEGDDVIFGAGGDDVIRGGHDDDLLIGGSGDDILTGNMGDDVLLGQTGDDILIGSSGDDILEGGRGFDILTGGGGADIFRFADISEAADTITDFKINNGDAIDISELLEGYGDDANIHDYIELQAAGDDMEVHVDPAGQSQFTLLVTLENMSDSMSSDPLDLLNEGNLIVNPDTIV